MIKATQKIQTQRQRVEKTVAKSSERKRDQALCARCGFINTKGSNYCSKCTFNLSVSVASSSPHIVPTPTAGRPLDNILNAGEQKSFVLYESPSYGFKMEYPTDWLVKDNDDVLVVAFGPMTDTKSAAIGVFISNQPVGMTLQSESESSLKNARVNFPIFILLNLLIVYWQVCKRIGLCGNEVMVHEQICACLL